MSLMRGLSVSKARANVKALFDRVVANRSQIAITRPKCGGAVPVSESEWASIEETLYLLRSPANAERLRDSVAELDAGKGGNAN
ncbi:MAG TPA: type II toxin-antitoxin system Phd/YefM family antitoxin [Sphingomonas sp.]